MCILDKAPALATANILKDRFREIKMYVRVVILTFMIGNPLSILRNTNVKQFEPDHYNLKTIFAPEPR